MTSTTAVTFSIHADPQTLDLAAQRLADLATHLVTQATEVAKAPGDLSGTTWAGNARDAITAEMSHLAATLHDFVQPLRTAAEALRTVAEEVRFAQRTASSVQAAFDDTARQLAAVHDPTAPAPAATTGADPAQATAAQNAYLAAQKAADARRADLHTQQLGLSRRWDRALDDLDAAFRTASQALAAATVLPVSDETVKGFVAAGGFGGLLAWTGRNGQPFPPDTSHGTSFLAGLPLAQQRAATDAAQRAKIAADYWTSFLATHPKGGRIDPAVLALMQRNADDPMFAKELLTQLGPDAVAAIPGRLAENYAETGQDFPGSPDEKKLAALRAQDDAVLAALGRMIAVTSREEASSPFRLPQTWTDAFLKASTDANLVPLTEILRQSLEADPKLVYGSDFLTSATTAVIDAYRTGDRLAIAMANQPSYGHPFEPGAASRDYPLQTMLTALANNPHAAGAFLTTGMPAADDVAPDGVPTVSAQVAWLLEHYNDLEMNTDDGAALGAALKAGMTAGGPDAEQSARATAWLVRWMGQNSDRLAIPDGAKEAVRGVLAYWHEALALNTGVSPKQVTVYGDNPSTPGIEGPRPRFVTTDVAWLMGQVFTSDTEVAPLTALILGDLRDTFRAQSTLAHQGDQNAANALATTSGDLGQWLRMLTVVHNNTELTAAQAKVDANARHAAWGKFVLDVLESLPAVGNTIKGVEEKVPTDLLKAFAEKGYDKGKDAANEGLIGLLFPEPSSVEEAKKAGAYAKANQQAFGQELMTTWLLQTGQVPTSAVNSYYPHGLPSWLIAHPDGSYTVDTTQDPGAWTRFVVDVGVPASGKGALDLHYGFAFAFDPGASS